MPIPTLPLSNEDEINLTSSIVNTSDGAQRISNGKNYFRLANTEIQQNLATIPNTILEDLYNEVSGFCTSNKDCVTALRFYLGAETNENSTVVKLFFEPLYLTFDKVNSTNQEREYVISETGNLSSFDGTDLIPENAANLSASQNDFVNNLKLKHYTLSTGFEDFINGEDVEALVLPFQTFFALLNDNNASEFTIHHCADVSIGDDVTESLILSAVENSNNGPFAGKLANRFTPYPPPATIYSYDII